MNELTESWVVVFKQGGMPDNWLYKEVGGRRVFAAKEARDILKTAGPDWHMLHATGFYPAEEWVGNPDHFFWGTHLPPHPNWSEERLQKWKDERK